MRTSVFVLTVIAAAIPSLAVTADATHDKQTSASAPAQMTDAEMDRVTAAGEPSLLGEGVRSAFTTGVGQPFNGVGNGIFPHAIPETGKCIGLGTLTTGTFPAC
jgi:hypothetical protein